VLICAHNRREKSLACLRRLQACHSLDDLDISVYFVDDGSTDGTAEAVAVQFPKVNLIRGKGDLYWSGGISAAWAEAAHGGHDFYIWLNDDVEITPGSIAMSVAASATVGHRAILCGATTSPISDELTYGGRDGLDTPPIAPNGQLQSCRLINGNFVLVPRSVFERLGGIDPGFVHDIGDYDYGLRALAAGIECHVLPQAIGTCARNDFVQKWRSQHIGISERFRNLYSPLGRPHPLQYFRFARRHFGLLSALRSFAAAHLRAFWPGLTRGR
jgi:GT2 family glycosyltransferase